MNKKRTSYRMRALIGAAALHLMVSAPLTVSAAAGEIMLIEQPTVTIDGEQSAWDASMQLSDGRLYVPVGSLADLFEATTAWDQKNATLTIHTDDGDKIVMSDGVPVAFFNGRRYRMDAAPYVTDGRTYVPLRYAAGFLGATVVWNVDERRADLAMAESSDALVASEFQEAKPYAVEDLLLLAKLVQVEAGYESYEGQLAVANVILNRVGDARFPDSIHEVIYSGVQFPPAHNGLLDKSEPNASVLRATKDAMNGKNNVEGAIYFYNPDVTDGAFWERLSVVAEIGNHRFAK
ncbi:cell wall hydrolase [Paenibacillus alkalitolerans]|uniref:cell wall hydrolase n=1 Tax=Paenibacillus alkalitolerans TaxID=2799335 RepID=UPI0018F62750|nr:cell wall hydrolase [Paenibacillus alkalitolerans]